MNTQTVFEADDFILCTKCNLLLMIPANTKQVICSECENVMDFVNICEIHKFLSYKRAFKHLSQRIYKERTEKNYVYNSKLAAALVVNVKRKQLVLEERQDKQVTYEQQQAAYEQQQAAAQQAAYEQQQAAAAAQHAAAQQAGYEQQAAAAAQQAAAAAQQAAAAAQQVAYEQQQAAAAAQHAAYEQEEADRLVTETQLAAEQQAAYEKFAVRKEQERQAQEREKVEAELWALMETRQAANTLLLVPIAVRLHNSIIKN